MKKAILAIGVVCLMLTAAIPAMGLVQSTKPVTKTTGDENYGIRIVVCAESGINVVYEEDLSKEESEAYTDNSAYYSTLLDDLWTAVNAQDQDGAETILEDIADGFELNGEGSGIIAGIIDMLFGMINDYTGENSLKDVFTRVSQFFLDKESRNPNVIFSAGLGDARHKAATQMLYEIFYPEGEMGEGYWILPIDINYKLGVTAVASWPFNLRTQLNINRGGAASMNPKGFKGIYINVGKLVRKYDVDDGLIMVIGTSWLNPYFAA